jgi:hypothetical protein
MHNRKLDLRWKWFWKKNPSGLSLN